MQTEKKTPKTSTSASAPSDSTRVAWQRFFEATYGKGHDIALNMSNSLGADAADKFMHFSAYLLECMVVPRPVERLEGWNKRLDKWREFLVTPLNSVCDCIPPGKTKRYACPHDLRLFEKKFPHPPISDELFGKMVADGKKTSAIWMRMHQVIDEEDKKQQPAKDEKTKTPSSDPDRGMVPACASCGHSYPALSCSSCPKKFCSIICKMASCGTTDAKSQEARYARVDVRGVAEFSKRIRELESNGVLPAVWAKLIPTMKVVNFLPVKGESTAGAAARWQRSICLRKAFPPAICCIPDPRIKEGVRQVRDELKRHCPDGDLLYSVFSGEYYSHLAVASDPIVNKYVNPSVLGQELMDKVRVQRRELGIAALDALRAMIRYTFPLVTPRCCMCAGWCPGDACKHCHRRVCPGQCYLQHPCIGEKVSRKFYHGADLSLPPIVLVLDSLRDPILFESSTKGNFDLMTHLLYEHQYDYDYNELKYIMRRFTELEQSGWFERRWQEMCTEGKFDQGLKERLREGKGSSCIAGFAAAQMLFSMGSGRIDGPSFFDPQTRAAMTGLTQFWTRAGLMNKELKDGTFCPLCIVEGVNPQFLDDCLKAALPKLEFSACQRIAQVLVEKKASYNLVAKFSKKLYKKVTARCGVCGMAGAMYKCRLCKMQMCGKKQCYGRHPGIQKCKQAYAASKQQKK